MNGLENNDYDSVIYTQRSEAHNVPGMRPVSLYVLLCSPSWCGNFWAEADFSVIETSERREGSAQVAVTYSHSWHYITRSQQLQHLWMASTSSEFWRTSERQKLMSRSWAREQTAIPRIADWGRISMELRQGKLPVWNKFSILGIETPKSWSSKDFSAKR